MTYNDAPRLLPEGDSFSAIRQRMQELQRIQLQGSVSGASQINPQQASRALSMGLQAGTPSEYMNAFGSQMARQNVLDLASQSPLTAEFFSKPDWAAVSWDIPEEPGVLESTLDFFKNTGSSFGAGIADIGAFGIGLEIALLESLLSKETAPFIQPLVDRLRRDYGTAKSVSEEMQVQSESDLGTFYYGMTRSLPLSLLSLFTGGYASVARGASLAAAAGVGSSVAGIAVGGGAYMEAREQDVPRLQSLLYGASVGGAEAVFERYGLGKLFANINIKSPLGKAIRDQVFAEAGSEAATEAVQSFFEWSGLPENKDVSVGQFLSRLPYRLYIAAGTGALMGGTLGTAGYTLSKAFGDHKSQQVRAQLGGDAIDRVNDVVQRSKLRQRSPEVFRQLVQLGQGENILRVESRILSEAVDGTIGTGTLASTQPELARRIHEAGTEPGTEIELTIGEYNELIGDGVDDARNSLRDVLRNHLYVNDNSLTVAESELADQEAAAFLEAAERREQSRYEQEQEADSELSQVYSELAKKFNVEDEAVEPEPEISPEQVAEAAQEEAAAEVAPAGQDIVQAAVDAGIVTEEQVAAVTEQVQAMLPQEEMAAPAEPAVTAPPEAAPTPAERVRQERVAMRDWFGQSVAKDASGRPIRMAARELTGEPGVAAYSESPFGEGGVAISMQNPLELTGNNANAVIANPKARQKALDKARAAGKDGVIAYGKRKGRDGKVVRDTIYIPLDEAQARPISRDPDILFSRPLDEDDAQPTATPEEAEEYRRLAEGVKTPFNEYISNWEENRRSYRQKAADSLAEASTKDVSRQVADSPEISRLSELVDAAAKRAAKYVFPVFHGLSKGYLYGRSFDPSRLGLNTRAASALGGFFSGGKIQTAKYYADTYNGDPLLSEESRPILYSYFADINKRHGKIFSDTIESLKEILSGPFISEDNPSQKDALRFAARAIDRLFDSGISQDNFFNKFPVTISANRDILGRLYGISEVDGESLIDLNYIDNVLEQHAKRFAYSEKHGMLQPDANGVSKFFVDSGHRATRIEEFAFGRGLYVRPTTTYTRKEGLSLLVGYIRDTQSIAMSTSEVLSEFLSRAESPTGSWLRNEHNVSKISEMKRRLDEFADNIERVLEAEREWINKQKSQYIADRDAQISMMEGQTIAPKSGIFRGYVFMNNPLIYDMQKKDYREVTYNDLVNQAKAEGRDGLIIKNTADPYEWDDIYVVFRPEQIKSREPVLYETEARGGGLIGLEERFNLLTDDVYYSKDLGLDDSVPAPEDTKRAALSIFTSMIGNLAKAVGVKPTELMDAYNLSVQEGEVDGRASYKPKNLLVTLGEKANALDIQHELTHHFMHMLFTSASASNASPEVIAMAEKVLSVYRDADGKTTPLTLAEWHNLPEADKVRFHEALADWHTLYITKNKAPSAGVRRVMEILSGFLRATYRDLYNTLNRRYQKQFGVNLPALTEDVEVVFGALMASERAIKATMAAEGIMPQFQTQEEAGATDAEWAEYQDLQTMEEEMAIADLTSKTIQSARWFGREMQGLTRQIQRQVRDLRIRVRREVEDEVNQETIYKLRDRLRRNKVWQDGKFVDAPGDLKLNGKLVRKVLGDAATEAADGSPGSISLSGQYGRNGLIAKNGALDPTLVAEVNGFESAADMLRQLIQAESAKEKIDRLVGERLAKQFSQFHNSETGEVDPAKIRKAALDAISSPQFAAKARARKTALEIKFIEKAGRPVRATREGAARAARVRLAGTKLANIRPQRHRASALRASRLALQVMRDGYDGVLRKAQQSVESARRAVAKAKQKQAGVQGEDAVAAQRAVKSAETRLESATSRLEDLQTVQPAQTISQAQETGAGQRERLILRAKRNQLAEEQMERESTLAQEEVEKGKRKLKQVAGDGKRSRIGADFSDLIDNILVMFKDGSSASAESIGNRGVATWDTASILKHLQERNRFIEEDQIELDFLKEIRRQIADGTIKQFDINQLTLDQFRDLLNLIKMLEHVGKSDQQLLASEKKQSADQQKEELKDSIVANSKAGRRARRESKSWFESLKKSYHKHFFLAHTRMATLCFIMDGGKVDGPLWNFLANSANRIEAARLEELRRITKELNSIISPLLGPLRLRFKRNVGELAGLSDARRAKEGRTTFTVEEVFMMLVNMGNDGNKSRLLRGENWEEADVLAAISQVLTKEEVEAAQQIWDLFEEFWPRIDQLERDVYGVSPVKVQRVPLTITLADGTQVNLQGGYTPIVYDSEATDTQRDMDAADAAKSDLGYVNTSATTKRTHAMRRGNVGTGDPLSLFTDGMLRGFRDIIHDLHWRPWLIDVRTVFSRGVRQTITDTYGSDTTKEIERWIKGIANANRTQSTNEDGWAAYVARNVSFSRLAGSAASAIIQLTGILTIPLKVGPVAFAKGLARFLSGGPSMLLPLKEIGELDPAMRVRMQTQNRELNEITARIRGKSKASEVVYAYGMVPLLYIQSFADAIAWHSGMAYAEEQGIVELDKQIDIARQTVFDTQGDQGLQSRASVERGDALMRLFTVFISYPITILNLRRAIAADSQIGKVNKVTRMMALAVLLPAVEVLIKDIMAPDEEEKDDLATYYLKKIGIASTRQMFLEPFVGLRELADVINIVMSDDYQRGYEGPAGLSLIGSALELSRQVTRVVSSDESLVDQDMRLLGTELINVLAWAFPIPSAQINRSIKGYNRIIEEGVPPHAILFGTQK